MNSSKQIKIGAMLSYFAIAFNIVSGLLYTPWMVETIGKSQYGLYTLANSLITMFMVDFGLSAATSRYLAKYNAEGDKAAAERFLGAVYKLYILIDAVIFCVLLVVFFFLDQIYVKLTPAELEQFKVVYVISALFSVINFPFVTFNGILTAYEKFVPLKVIDLLYRVFNIGFTVIALLLGYGLYALVSVHAIVGLLVLLLKFIAIKKSIPLKVDFKTKEKELYKEIFSFSLWVTVSSLALRLVFNITPSILGIVANAAAIAVFGIVTTIEGYTYTITNAIKGMFMPRIAKLMAADKGAEDLNKLLLGVGKFQFALNGLIVAGFAVAGQHFIQLWMGPDYTLAYYGILLVIAPGMFYNSLQIADTTMIVQKKVKSLALINLATGVINVTLSFPMSAQFGVTGACISICIAYCVRAISLAVVSHKSLPMLDIPRFVRSCQLRMLTPVAISIAGGFAVSSLIQGNGWLAFLLKAAATTVIYAIATVFLGLTAAERKQIFNKLKRNH